MPDINLQDHYEFSLVGGDQAPFHGYVSSIDKTTASPQVLVRGSKNVYKKISGTIANRPGVLRRGAIDATNAPVKAAWEWYTSLGSVLPLRVANGKLQVESNIANGSDYVWYDLLTGLTLTRFVFDSWWDNSAKKDTLIMVNGDSTIKHWSGGMAVIAAVTAPVTGTIATVAITAGGSGYSVGTVLTVTGGGGAGGTLNITAVDGSGAVTAVTIETPGASYSTGAGAATTASAGSGCTINILTIATTATITKTGTTSWAQAGFTSAGSLTINGNTYAYLFGADTTTLTGVTPTPAGEALGSVAIQAVGSDSNKPSSTFTNDFIKVIGNRLHVGSYTSRLIYISANDSYTNFTVPTPRTPGTPELLTLDNTGKGISLSKGNAFISAGLKDWYEVSYSALTVGTTATEVTKVDKKPTAELSAALCHEFIDTVGDDIVYLSQDQQIRVLGTFRNISTQKIPSISQEVFDELQQETFVSGLTVGHLRAVGDFIYLTAPVSGITYLRQTRETVDTQGNVVAERLWHPPQIWNICRIAVINGVVFGHSNANPQIYRLWDTNQWHDDSPSGNLSYDSVMLLAYRNLGRRQGMHVFNKMYVEGYLTEGTTLIGRVFLDYQGSRGSQQPIINSVAKPATLFIGQDAPSLGDSSLGDNPLGDGLNTAANDQDLLPKFRAICGLNPINCFEYQLGVFSNMQDDRWEIICIGTNAIVSREQQAGFIAK